MKLKQNEYCHNCREYVDFEFEDTTDKQIIYCPNCGHEHYRELDAGIITNIRLHGNQQVIYTAKLPEIELMRENIAINMPKAEIISHKVIGKTQEGNAILDTDGSGKKIYNKVSNRRWGRDPRQ